MKGHTINIDLIDAPVVIIGSDYAVKAMNRAARETYAQSGQDGMKTTCFALSHGFAEPCEKHGGHPCPMDTLKNAPHGTSASALHIHETGEGRRYFTVRITRDAETDAYVEIQSDVTDYVLGFVRLFETVSDGIVLADAAGDVLFANTAFTGTFGPAACEATTGKDIRDVITRAAADKTVAMTVVGVAEDRIDGVELVLESGRTVQVTCRPVRIMECDAGYLWHVRDISGEEALRRDLAEHTDQLERIARHSPAAIVIVRGGTIAYANQAAATLFEVPVQELLDREPTAFLDQDLVPSDGLGVFKEGRESGHTQVRIRTATGQSRWVDVTAATTTLGGKEASLFTLFDLTPFKSYEQQLRQSEEMFKGLAENLLTGMFLYREKFLYVNPKMTELTGYARDELLKRGPREFLPVGTFAPEDFDAAYRENQPKGASYRELEMKTRHGDVRIVHLYTNIIPYMDGFAGIGNVIDVTEMSMLRDELERAATIDNLTGILNRRHFEDILGKAIPNAQRYGQPLSVIMFDIDHFKKVNDSLGHQAGDSVLVDIGHVVGRRMRDADSFCRWGGEEFMLALPNTDLPSAEAVAEDLRAIIETSVSAGDSPITASFGVTCCNRFDTIETLTARADAALYEAKHAGRNRVEVDPCDGERTG